MQRRSVKVWLWTGIFLYLTLPGIFVSNAQAETEREKKLEEQVQMLLQRVDQLETRLATVESKPAAAAVKPATKDPKSIEWKWKDGLTFGTPDGAYQFKFGARIQNDWYAGDVDKSNFSDGTRFRRLWLKMDGTIYDDLEYKFAIDFANAGVALRDAYMGYTGLDFAKFRIGQFREPFNLENLTSNADLTFLERSPLTSLGPDRKTGFMVYNEILDQRMTWAIGGFKSVDNNSANSTDNATGKDYAGDWDVAARITGLPWYEDAGKKLIHLGLSGIHRDMGDDPTRIRAFGSFYGRGSDINYYMLDTGSDYLFDTLDLLGAEFALVYGPASLQAEYVYGDVDGQTVNPLKGKSGSVNAAYVQASYFLTGENRPYKAGIFGKIKPKNNFSLKENGGWGAWELATRYIYVDLEEATNFNDKKSLGGDLNDLAFGVNWYLNPNVRIMWDYVHSESDIKTNADREADLFLMRLQYDF